MYANDRTLEMGEDGKAAVREFLARAAEARLVPPTKTTFVDDIEGSA
jgi:predicted solute-binding protein